MLKKRSCAFCGSTSQIISHKMKKFKHSDFCFRQRASDEPSCFKNYYMFVKLLDWSKGIPFAFQQQDDRKNYGPCGNCGSVDFTIFNPNTSKHVFKYAYFCKNSVCYRSAYLYMIGLRESPRPFLLLTLKHRNYFIQQISDIYHNSIKVSKRWSESVISAVIRART
jgi:hypothetical protein